MLIYIISHPYTYTHIIPPHIAPFRPINAAFTSPPPRSPPPRRPRPVPPAPHAASPCNASARAEARRRSDSPPTPRSDPPRTAQLTRLAQARRRRAVRPLPHSGDWIRRPYVPRTRPHMTKHDREVRNDAIGKPGSCTGIGCHAARRVAAASAHPLGRARTRRPRAATGPSCRCASRVS